MWLKASGHKKCRYMKKCHCYHMVTSLLIPHLSFNQSLQEIIGDLAFFHKNNKKKPIIITESDILSYQLSRPSHVPISDYLVRSRYTLGNRGL